MASINKGVYIVRFRTMENRDKVLETERPFFDNKPLMIKPWHPDIYCSKEEVKIVPIWVNLYLDFKYWGFGCLEKITQPLGKLLKLVQANMQDV